MSGLWYDSTDPEVVDVWERDLIREVRAKGPLLDPKRGFIGKGSGSLIQTKDQLTNGPGASITTKLRYQLDGRGRAGNETLEGHGEGYKTSTFAITVDVLRHYVETSSPMVDQFVPEDTLMEGKDGLADWIATRYEFGLNLHATGWDLVTDPAYNLNVTPVALNSEYLLRPNGKTAASLLDDNDTFDVDVVNDAVMRLKLLEPKIRPASTPLGDKYVMFLAPEQVRSLRESDSIWFQSMQNALAGGVVDDNPLLSNALGMWSNVIFFESDLIPPGIDDAGTGIQDKTRRAWIGGAQALFLAHGRGNAPKGYALNRYRWDKDTKDFGHKGQIACTTIVGAARPRYTRPGEGSAREHGLMVVETYADYGGLTNTTVYKRWIDAGGGLSITT